MWKVLVKSCIENLLLFCKNIKNFENKVRIELLINRDKIYSFFGFIGRGLIIVLYFIL